MKLFPTHSRWRVGLIGLILLLLGYAGLVEPNWIQVTTWPFQGAGQGSGPTIRLVQVSDLHLRQYGWREQRVVALIHRMQPDLVLLTGDMVVTPSSLPGLEAFLTDLAMPNQVIAIFGNWEHYLDLPASRLRELYQRHQVRLLVNESMALNFGASTLWITGLDDPLAGIPDPVQALRGVPPAANHLVLCHTPGYFDEIRARWQPDLVLSGHTHGGQISLFGWDAVLPPGSGPYSRGWYGEGWPRLFVSRGLGMSLLPLRFWARPELPVLEWSLH